MSEKASDHLSNQEVKLEDILKSIRGVIDNHSESLNSDKSTSETFNVQKEDNVLELTSVFYPSDSVLGKEEEYKVISERVKLESLSKLKGFSDQIEEKGFVLDNKNESSLDNITFSIMKPLIKEWLDNNLLKLVEKVISEEIKQLIPKKK